MPTFSKKSLDKLATVDRRLYDICSEAIKLTDFTIICGYRGKEEQDAAFATGNSKFQFPNSKHNTSPSQAIDIAPYPVDWDDIERFKRLAIVIKKCASDSGIGVSWGGDWKKFKDYPHWELI